MDLAHEARALRGLALRLCRNAADADDLVHDVIEKALRAMPADAHPRAWLARTMRNLAIDRVRRRAVRREDFVAEIDVLPAAANDEAPAWSSLTADDVRAQLATLPDDQRVTFEMFAFDGASYDMIAARLGTPKATVGTRILRARNKLRVALSASLAAA